jgi:hypothetical protein
MIAAIIPDISVSILEWITNTRMKSAHWPNGSFETGQNGAVPWYGRWLSLKVESIIKTKIIQAGGGNGEYPYGTTR